VSQAGLSPRSRGNRDNPAFWLDLAGTIPALAGKPNVEKHGRQILRDYPRARGGTVDVNFYDNPFWGLSPRSRGNRKRDEEAIPASGTIPALAGEPRTWGEGVGRSRDYPRARGGTSRRTHSASRLAGLSPRSRGNHQETHL